MQDSVAAASQTGDDYDDSDMYMEPEAAGTSGKSTVKEAVPAESSPLIVKSEETEIKEESTETAETQDEEKKEDKSLESDSQNFFPSFAEIFGNQRLNYGEQQQQQRYRPNRFLSYLQQRDRSGYQATATSNAKEAQHPLLGSGNFGVIRGGTYYPEDKEADDFSVDDDIYNPYYSGSGRVRSNYYRNPKPQVLRGGDLFANFRDFADITAPPKSSFSHLSVVYANRNATDAGPISKPRNIIEALRMLVDDEEYTTTDATTTLKVPTKKLSLGKRKLIKMKKYEEDKARKSRMTVEPLLALS